MPIVKMLYIWREPICRAAEPLQLANCRAEHHSLAAAQNQWVQWHQSQTTLPIFSWGSMEEARKETKATGHVHRN